MVLEPDHRAKLYASGIKDHAIDRCRFHSVTSPAEIRRLLRRSKNSNVSELGACLVMPYFAADGKPVEYLRVRPSRPRLTKKRDSTTKIAKYEAPRALPVPPYFPPFRVVWDAIKCHSQSLFVTEGEFKAVTAAQEGIPTIALAGVWTWNIPQTNALKPELDAIEWTGRTVYIVFDSDAATNRMVRLAEFRLAMALQKKGAIVRIIRLPTGTADEDGQPCKVGLDDFLVKNAATALWSLAKAATDPQAPAGVDEHGKRPWETDADPHFLARQYLEEYAHPDHYRLARHRETLQLYTDRWAPVSDDAMRASVTAFAKRKIDEIYRVLASAALGDDTFKQDRAPKVTTAVVGNILQALAGYTIVADHTPTPCWLANDRAGADYIGMANGILDVQRFLRGEADCLLPATPAWFSPVRLDYPFEVSADYPRWRAFLRRNLDGEQSDKALLLQQWFGYCLLFDVTLQRFLMMVGDGANGKSVACAVMRAMLGEENVTSIPLELFGARFALETTVGKLANIAAEVGEIDRVAEGQLKAFTAGDLMEFERKFKTPYMAKPTARLTLSTNNPPDFRDRSDGLWRRMLLLTFTVQIPEEERVAGMDQPAWWADERSGIFNWALVGLYNLRQAGRFNVPAECRAAVEKMRNDANPARRFLIDNYQHGVGMTPKPCLYDAYCQWCKGNGHHPLGSNKFAAEVYRTFKEVRESEPTLNGKRVEVFAGLEERSA
jgi:P4 family phage/plasmid primase-like protien